MFADSASKKPFPIIKQRHFPHDPFLALQALFSSSVFHFDTVKVSRLKYSMSSKYPYAGL